MRNKFLGIIKDTSPVIAGYIILGIGFGMLMSTNGFGLIFSVFMSLFIYAGSMQYVAVGLFTGGVSYLAVVLTTIAVNARHLFYGISMIKRYKNAGLKKPYLIFALTDETYSLVCDGEKDNEYCFWVSLFNQIYWVTGTIIGSIMGSTIDFNSKGIDFSLTALFVTVFLEQWMKTKNHFAAITGVACSLVSLLVMGKDNFLIPAMVGIVVILLLSSYKEGGNDK